MSGLIGMTALAGVCVGALLTQPIIVTVEERPIQRSLQVYKRRAPCSCEGCTYNRTITSPFEGKKGCVGEPGFFSLPQEPGCEGASCLP